MDLHEQMPLPPLRTWTRREYDNAIALGIFEEDERLELLEGIIVRKMPQRGPHVSGIRLTETALRSVFTVGWEVRTQMPLALLETSEPEPDIAVVAGTIRDFEHAHPTTAALVVEVADTSLAVDRKTKAGICAKAGIAEYWILNLQERCLEVHRHPRASSEQPLGWNYAERVVLDETATASPLAAPGTVIAVADLLPRS
jgi:Uma2 family endonuclease